MNTIALELKKKLEDKTALIGVIGLGYVGMPLALEFARAGFRVIGYDVDPKRVAEVNAGRSYIGDIKDEELGPEVRAGRLRASLPDASIGECDTISICVPTPLRKSKDPDMRYIVSATDEIAKRARKGQLIVLESTTYPGTTTEVVMPRIEAKGLRAGEDFFIAFSPERVDPGNPTFHTRNTPKVVGGHSDACRVLSKALYAHAVDRVVIVSSPAAAEMVKLLENTFRSVNIGLVNEMAIMCRKLGCDVWEVIEAASTKPFGFMPFWPGPGLGGHCIPIDPHYLSWKLKTLNYNARFIEMAGEINSHMPDYVVDLVGEALNEAGKAVKGSKILVLGVAYKKNVDDCRESPAIDVIELLRKRGASVSYADPHVPELRHDPVSMDAVPYDAAALSAADCVVVVTDHAAFDPDLLARHAKVVVDTRNMLKGRAASGTVVKL